MSKIALLGPKFMFSALAAAGVDVFSCDSTLQSRQRLAELADRGEHEIIFMDERYSSELRAEIEAAEEKGLNIVLLPDHRGSTGLFREMLHELIRKATGALS